MLFWNSLCVPFIVLFIGVNLFTFETSVTGWKLTISVTRNLSYSKNCPILRWWTNSFGQLSGLQSLSAVSGMGALADFGKDCLWDFHMLHVTFKTFFVCICSQISTNYLWIYKQIEVIFHNTFVINFNQVIDCSMRVIKNLMQPDLMLHQRKYYFMED